MTSFVVLDGPMGTELERRGLRLPAPAWSAVAVEHHPDAVLDVHRTWVRLGARVHVAATFRTRPEAVGERWEALTGLAVGLARAATPIGHTVLGGLAPIADCYRPDLSPPDAAVRHRAFAAALARCGVDGILCETFPHPSEALAAVDAALATGLPTWLSLTAGPEGDLLDPATLAATARAAHDRGAQAVLVGCVAADRLDPFVHALSRTNVPFGVKANAGRAAPLDVDAWRAHAQRWAEAGARWIGGCCGTLPEHTAALSDLVDTRQ